MRGSFLWIGTTGGSLHSKTEGPVQDQYASWTRCQHLPWSRTENRPVVYLLYLFIFWGGVKKIKRGNGPRFLPTQLHQPGPPLPSGASGPSPQPPADWFQARLRWKLSGPRKKHSGQLVPHRGWTKSCTTWKPLFVGIHIKIILPGSLWWCRILSIHCRSPFGESTKGG